MDKTNILEISKYLKRVSDSYDKTKTMDDIYDSFRCMSKEYQEFNSNSIVKNEYDNEEYSKCSEKDKLRFAADQLIHIESLVCNSIYERVGIIWNWKDIFDLLSDPIYKNTEKSNRKVVFSALSNDRPIGEKSFDTWNGIQIIDIDIKDKEIAEGLKPLVFNDLKKFNWFLGVCKSASGKSLHVWTKISTISTTHEQRKIEYLCNFRHKFSYLYIVLSKYCDKFGYTKEKILDYMDMAMAKPQQGIFITSDDTAMMSTNFVDLRLDVNFESAFNTGIESINWISHPELKQLFSKLEWFNNDKFSAESHVELSEVSNINEHDPSKSVKKHYKHAQRWQLANTLTAIYGADKALQIMTQICLDTDYKELKGDVKTAEIHNKPISIWAVKELNRCHGYNIKLKNADEIYKSQQDSLKSKEVETTESTKESPTSVLNARSNMTVFNITSKQYLSDIKDDIISNLGHITLLEAGAGYGKTEMIKSLKAKTLLILPFTSTIKAKIESSETTSDWLYYYGSKRPTLDDLLGDRNMSMTIDKFSRLNVMELDTANFEYIVLDESHLLFTSSYRDVMSPTIQRLANCKAKIIMMTGTPTGELLFFPDIKHIKVKKEDIREKIFELNMCPSATEQLVEMCKSMAKDIVDGKKILFPTNRGNLYFEQVTGIIQKYLDGMKFSRPINCFYYKKSNYGDDSMDNINIDKTIGNNDIIFCTTYLSVGVDICDRYKFSVYFNEQWIPQDIEQFANRLRNNDLYIKMFLPKKDSMGIPINYYFTQALDLSFEEKDLLLARDLIKTCNDMLERNNEESKYNPLIQSLLSSNKYLKYDENDCKYYIDETTYKLKVFEERYSVYSKQLEVLIKGIEYYGYKIDVVDHVKEVPETRKEEIAEYLRSCRSIRYNYNTVQTMNFLDHINDGNIDMYKELLKGNYQIFKDKEYKEQREQNTLYAEDIEVLERNTPIVVSLYKFYDCETIKDIFEYCIEKKQNRINYSKLQRIRRFVNIEYNRKKKRLDFPILRFIKDAQDWATRNYKVTKGEIDDFLKTYAAKYANSIKDVVVEDVEYLQKIYELICELWKVIIIQGNSKNGVVTISPFELLWDKKESLDNIYGNTETKTFFLQELIDDMKSEEPEEEEEVIPDLPHTSKYKLEQIEHELKNIVHKEYDYFDYSTKDKSNERFMLKQKNTNQLVDTLFEQVMSEDIHPETKITIDASLFDNCKEEDDDDDWSDSDILDKKVFDESCPF